MSCKEPELNVEWESRAWIRVCALNDGNMPDRWQHSNPGHCKNKCSSLKALKASCNDRKVTIKTLVFMLVSLVLDVVTMQRGSVTAMFPL